MQAWIVVGAPENFELLRDRGFEVCAFKSSRRKQSGEMKPGDRIVFYLTGDVQFGGIVEVLSEMFEDDSDIGLRSDSKEAETFPLPRAHLSVGDSAPWKVRRSARDHGVAG